MYARVIPSIRLPRKLGGIFDYSVPEALQARISAGSFVFVPWRGRTLPGIVAGVSDAPSAGVAATKPIRGFASAEALPADFLAAIEDTATVTVASRATVVYAFLPRVTPRTAPELAIAEPSRTALVTCAARRKKIIRYASAEEKFTAALAMAKDAVEKNLAALLLVPHSGDVAVLVAFLRAHGVTDVIELHGGLAAPAYRRAWFAALAAEAPIVVGTRVAAMAPVRSLGTVAILECESVDHRQYDQNPRFDARRIALLRADAAAADIALLSHAPRADEYHLVKTRGFSAVDPGVAAKIMLVTPPLGAKKTFADRFGEEVSSRVEEAVQSRKKVLIFHNRRGASTALVCRQCRNVSRCPTCEIALILHGDGRLQCHRCGYRTAAPTLCPACNGMTLAGSGVGSESIAALATMAFPEARVARFDTDGEPPTSNAIAAADILVGTHLLLHEIAEMPGHAGFGAIVASDADTWLFRPGFRALEQAWRIARTLADAAAVSACFLFMMTSDPENPKLRAMLDPWQRMADRELAARAALGYPPHLTQIALTVQDPDEKAAERRGRELAVAFGKRVGDAAVVYGPFRHATPYVRGKWRHVILLKSRRDADLYAALHELPDDILVETDPESIAT